MAISPIHAAGQSQRGRETVRDLLELNYQRKSSVQLAAGSSVPLLRDHLWLVVRGMVKLSCVTINGDDVLLGLAGRSELFGECLTGVGAYEATTLSDCELLCLSVLDLEKQPHMAAVLVKAISQRQRQSQAWLALMGLKRVEERIRGFLELLAVDYGTACAEGLRLTPRLTHQEIASAVGTTRVTVTRIIGQLKDVGWLSLDRQRSIVVSPLPKR